MEPSKNCLIIVTEASQLKQASKLYEGLLLCGRNPLIISEDHIKLGEKYCFKSFRHYQDTFKINYFDIRGDVSRFFSSLEFFRNKTMYKGVSLWELSANYIFFVLVPIFYNITLINMIFDHEKPQEVHLMTNDKSKEMAFEIIAGSRQVKHFIHTQHKRGTNLIPVFFLNILKFAKENKRFLFSVYLLLLNCLKSVKIGNRYKIIFFAPAERFFVSMLSVVLKYSDSERIVINIDHPGSAGFLKNNKVFFTDFYGYKLYSSLNKEDGIFLGGIKESVLNDAAFFAQLFYKGFPIGRLLKDMFRHLIYEEFPEKIREINIVRKIVSSYKPELIVVADSSFNIALITKSLSMPFISMQTGHADEFVLFGPVLADGITVEGNYWKKYLISKSVVPEKIWACGPPKFDLRNNNHLKNPNTNRKKSKKKVVFASAYAASSSGMFEYENIDQVYAILNAIKKIDNTHLVIKLHPFDKNLNFYQRAAEETGVSDYSIISNVDISEVLSDCDLLIVHFSKASYEAVLMNKNVIFLSCSSSYHWEDIWDYKKYGAVIALEKLQDLEKHIRSVLFDTEMQEKLRSGRERYISEHAFKIDGLAGHRVKQVLDKFINSD